MLKAVHSIHEERIIHGDLKPANFLFVRGALKLIDFGIAKAIQNDDTTNIYRESQIGTLNYMSPEAILDSGTSMHGQRMKCGRVRSHVADDISFVVMALWLIQWRRFDFSHTLFFAIRTAALRYLVFRLHPISNGVRENTICRTAYDPEATSDCES